MLRIFNKWLGKFLIWRVRNISQRQFILMLSVLVGLISGTVAVLLKNTVHFVQSLFDTPWLSAYHQVFYFIFPLIGIFLTVIVVKFVIKRPVGEGIPGTLYAISKQNGLIPAFKMYAAILTSSITVGFGVQLDWRALR